MAQYQWRAGAPKPKVDADVFGAEVERIAAQNDGIASPESIVQAAMEPNSPISAAFEWSEAAAAHQHRLAQARRWVGSLQIVRVDVRHTKDATARGFHSVQTPAGHGYAATGKIVGDRDLTKQILQQAARDLGAQVTRFRSIAALGAFVPRLQSVLDDVEREIGHLTVDAQPRAADPALTAERERPAA